MLCQTLLDNMHHLAKKLEVLCNYLSIDYIMAPCEVILYVSPSICWLVLVSIALMRDVRIVFKLLLPNMDCACEFGPYQ